LFFERPEGGETSVLVHIELHSEREQEDPVEFEELVRSSGANPVCFIKGSRKSPDARTFVGEGKLEEIAQACATITDCPYERLRTAKAHRG